MKSLNWSEEHHERRLAPLFHEFVQAISFAPREGFPAGDTLDRRPHFLQYFLNLLLMKIQIFVSLSTGSIG